MFVLSVSDPFATKGIEYLLILGFLACLPVVWHLLTSSVPATRPARVPVRFAAWSFPTDRLYHRAHTWARQIAPGVMRIGLDDFAQQLLGRLDRVLVPAAGSSVGGGRANLEVQTAGRAFRLPSPVSGRVLRVNEALDQEGDLVNSDPYGGGWLMDVRSDEGDAGRKDLHPAGRVTRWLQEFEAGLWRTVHPQLGQVLQDGGTLTTDFAGHLPTDRWCALLHEHLHAEAVPAQSEEVPAQTEIQHHDTRS